MYAPHRLEDTIALAQFPSKFEPIFDPYQYKVFYGGRGGAKSRSFAAALLILGTQRPLRILCAREIQNSIKESVKKLLEDEIFRLKLSWFYSYNNAEIWGSNGTHFIFHGLRNNLNNIKSIEGVDICWVEEANTVSEASLEVLLPTIRKAGSETWFSFNPDQPTDPVYKMFVTGPKRDDCLVVKVNWQDNPWFPNELRKQMEFHRLNFPKKYKKIWEGIPGASELAVILPEWWAKYTDRQEIENRCSVKIITADTAYKKTKGADFSVFQAWGFEGAKRIYLMDQLRGKWHFPELVKNAKAFWDKHTEVDSIGRGQLPARCMFIEDKASGISLVQTLEGAGIGVEAWTMDDYPDIPSDKVARAREASFLIYGRKVWIPDYVPAQPEKSMFPWVEGFVDECTSFAEDMSHEKDDQVDAMTMAALIWKSMGGGSD